MGKLVIQHRIVEANLAEVRFEVPVHEVDTAHSFEPGQELLFRTELGETLVEVVEVRSVPRKRKDRKDWSLILQPSLGREGAVDTSGG